MPNHSARSSTAPATCCTLPASTWPRFRAADTLLGLVLGAAVERRAAAWNAALAEQVRADFLTAIAGFEARRQHGDDALKSFHYSIDNLVHALGALQQGNRRQT